jgi:hypothetical protein
VQVLDLLRRHGTAGHRNRSAGSLSRRTRARSTGFAIRNSIIAALAPSWSDGCSRPALDRRVAQSPSRARRR